jgi:hypothetical protein
MCWNEDVSLNTFLFSGFVLLLIIYNNTYTKYKIKELNDTWIYVFIFSIILMQLIEYFIWKNIKTKYNHLFTGCAILLLCFQPIASLMLLTNKPFRNVMLSLYCITVIPYLLYKLYINSFYSVVKQGHLDWKLGTSYIWILWLFFLLYSLVAEQKWVILISSVIMLCVVCVLYLKTNTHNSMWCWGVNTIMLYYAGYLLFYLPFLEKSALC